MAHEPSGDDRTLVAVAGAGEPAVAAALRKAGLDASLVAADPAGPGAWRLYELTGSLAPEDPRLSQFGREPGIDRFRIIGGYATPLRPPSDRL
jgi:hypothetical protein